MDLANDIVSLGRIRYMPVVKDEKLFGLFSERDLIGATAIKILGLEQKRKSALLKSVLIKDMMKKKVITVKPNTLIQNAARLMAHKQIGCVPVVENEALIGLLNTTNILRYMERRWDAVRYLGRNFRQQQFLTTGRNYG